jgi:hypothetical protein
MITGGFSRFASGNPKEVEKSYEQLAKIGEVVDKHTPQITMIAGKLEPTFTDNLAVTSDKFILSHSPILGKKSPLPKIDPKSSEEECKAFFDKYYEISDLDATPTIIFDA